MFKKLVSLRNVMDAILLSLRLAWSCSPWLAFLSALFVVLSALLPIACLWALGRVVDVAMALFASGNSLMSPSFVWWMCAFGLFLFLSSAVGIGSSWVAVHLGERLSLRMSQLVHRKAALLDYQTLTAPSFQTLLHRAATGVAGQPLAIFQSFLGLASSALSFVGMALWLGNMAWWLPCLVFVVGLPVFVARMSAAREQFDVWERSADSERRVAYLNRILMMPDYAQEIKSYGVADYFQRMFGQHRAAVADLYLQSISKVSLWQLLGLGLASVGMLVVFGTVVHLAVVGQLSVGALAVYLMAIRRADVAARDVALRTSSLNSQALQASAVLRFLNVPVGACRGLAFPDNFSRIVFSHVSFAYPDSARCAIHDVSFSIKRGSVVALSGNNGSGKSTIASILCGLLRPNDGLVLADGVSLADVEPCDLWGHVAVLFQDFKIFCVSAQENICFGQSPDQVIRDRMVKAATVAGIHSLISSLPNGYDTCLGPSFSGSEMFSRGQWQRLALARVLYSNAELVVLDEPSSALDRDAVGNLAIVLDFLRNEGRTVLLITHDENVEALADDVVRI